MHIRITGKCRLTGLYLSATASGATTYWRHKGNGYFTQVLNVATGETGRTYRGHFAANLQPQHRGAHTQAKQHTGHPLMGL